MAQPAPALTAVNGREIAEHLCSRLGASHGETRLELIFTDGQLRRAFIHLGPIHAEALHFLETGKDPPLLGRR